MWLTIIQMILGLAPSVVNAIQTIHGDQVAGADKKKMAQDTLNIAVQAATGVLGNNPQEQALAQIAGSVASVAIDQAVAIGKATGVYQKATAIANAVSVAGQVVQAVAPAVTTVETVPFQTAVNPGLHA